MIIFISYTQKCNKDEDIVNEFEQIIKNNKDDVISCSVWRDVNILKSGDEFNDEIYRGILNCDIFVPFISKYSINANGVIKEIHSALFNRFAIKDKSPNYIKPVFIKDRKIEALDSLIKDKTDELVKQLVNDIKAIQYFPIERDNFKKDLNKFYDELKGSLRKNNLWKINGYCKFDRNDDKSWTLTYKPGYPSVVSYFLKERELIKEIKVAISFDNRKNKKTRVGISLRRHDGNPNDELFRFHITQQLENEKVNVVYYRLDRGKLHCITDPYYRPILNKDKSGKDSLCIRIIEREMICFINEKEIFTFAFDYNLYFKPEEIKEVQFMAWADGEDFEVKFSDCHLTMR